RQRGRRRKSRHEQHMHISFRSNTPMRCWIATLAAAAALSSGSLTALAQEADAPASNDQKALFERLDANNDGVLTREEVPQEQMRLFERLLRTADADGDAKLSLDEFVRGLADAPPPGD